jgi:hypothetical protein
MSAAQKENNISQSGGTQMRPDSYPQDSEFQANEIKEKETSSVRIVGGKDIVCESWVDSV